MSSTPWSPVFVLPNINLKGALGCDLAAIAPPNDRRVIAIRKLQRNFDKFLGRFSDNFGERFKPAVLLVRTDAPSAFFGVEALASFRDVVAISAIALGRASHISRRVSFGIPYAESFAIYPWMISKDFDSMIGNSPAMLGIHDILKFKGQSTPSIFRTNLSESNIDGPLLEALLLRWKNHHSSPVASWADIALFRSLNMAYHASMLPSGTETTYYDVGRLISLWVSAFEILVHPGGNALANLTKVLDLMERTHWLLDESSDPVHDTTSKKVKRTLASFIYDHMYRCRNDFFHGNPVGRDALDLPSGRQLFQYAAPLYRMGLTSFLPLVLAEPNDTDAKSIGMRVSKSIEFNGPQRAIERAILTATELPEELY